MHGEELLLTRDAMEAMRLAFRDEDTWERTSWACGAQPGGTWPPCRAQALSGTKIHVPQPQVSDPALLGPAEDALRLPQ